MKLEIISAASVLPMQVAGNEHYGDEVRLKNRFLDLRREKVKNNMILRSEVISFIRDVMKKMDFKSFKLLY